MRLYQRLHSCHSHLVQVNLLDDFGSSDTISFSLTTIGDDIMQDSNAAMDSNLNAFGTCRENLQSRANHIAHEGSSQIAKHDSLFTLDRVAMSQEEEKWSLIDVDHRGELDRGLGKDESTLSFDYRRNIRGHLNDNDEDLCFSPRLSDILDSPSGSVVSLTNSPLAGQAHPVVSVQQMQPSTNSASEQSRKYASEPAAASDENEPFPMDVALQMNAQEFPQLDPLFQVALQAPNGFEDPTNQVHCSAQGQGMHVSESRGDRQELEKTDQSCTFGSEVVFDDPCEAQSIADVELGIHFDRVDIDSLPVMKSPLQKSGRHTVIRGRLQDSHPFSTAARNLGYKLVSKRYENELGSRDEEAGRGFFMKDLNAFLSEIGNRHFKIPVIGGGDLDLYMLTKEVMRLGGVQNVVRKRAFRIVAQQLEIPKTCTSAASVLKGAYEKLLFHYEQRLVYGKWPEDPNKAVNMKERVCEERMKEKRARNACARVRRKTEEGLEQAKMWCDLEQLHTGDGAGAGDGSQSGASGNAREGILAVILADTGEPFALPQWASEYSTEDELSYVIKASRKVDVSKISTAGEAILLAAAECFDLPPDTDSLINNPNCGTDLCLAKDICLLPPENQISRKAQGFLFNLILMLTSSAEDLRLRRNDSADGLIHGLLFVLQAFYTRHLDDRKKAPMWDLDARVPFTTELQHDVTLDIAAAYCALRILCDLCGAQHAVCTSVMYEKLIPTVCSFLTQAHLHRTFILGALDTVQKVVCRVADGESRGVVTRVAGSVLGTIRRCTRRDGVGLGEDGEWNGDYEVCGKALKTMRCLTEGGWRLDGDLVCEYVRTVGELLGDDKVIGGVEGVGEVVQDLCFRYGEEAGRDVGFVRGVMRVGEQGRDVGGAVEKLRGGEGVQGAGIMEDV